MSDSQIILPKNKATLFPYPRPGCSHRNSTPFSQCIGTHSYCDSWVDIKNISPKFNALVCRGCDLIIHIPIDIRTWDELVVYIKEVRKND